jgi:DDE family transposase
MRLLHAAAKTSLRFDGENLVSRAGLVPATRLAARAGLHGLVDSLVRLTGSVGANAAAKIACLVAGMIAGVDTIEGMDLLRHGAMPTVFSGLRAPSTLGSFLRGFTHGNVAQLAAVHRRLLARLAEHIPPLLAGADTWAFIDIDSIQRRLFGGAKQGVGFGHTKIASKVVFVRGLNALIASIATPIAAPVVAAARLRGGSANSARGAAHLLTEAINTARQAGVTAAIMVRADSAYYSGKFLAAARRAGAYFSVTAPLDAAIRRAITTIPDHAWSPIRYPDAIYDEHTGEWISDAEIAETTYTAFNTKPGHRVTARLIVRRVKRRNPKSEAQGQQELFQTYRYHAVLTNSPLQLVQAEAQHRGHAVIEQLFADLVNGPLAHLPSGGFNANAAWLQLAAIAHNLTRALGSLASDKHGKARAATIRAELINVAARAARHGRGYLTWHLPHNWPWQQPWQAMFDATHQQPLTRTA